MPTPDPHATGSRAATFAYLDVAVTALNRAKDGTYAISGQDGLRALQAAEKHIYDVMEQARA